MFRPENEDVGTVNLNIERIDDSGIILESGSFSLSARASLWESFHFVMNPFLIPPDLKKKKKTKKKEEEGKKKECFAAWNGRPVSGGEREERIKQAVRPNKLTHLTPSCFTRKVQV